jgi:hypothetical protein
LGAINRRRRRVWVDGEEYGTETEAAEAARVAAAAEAAEAAGGRAVKGKFVSPEAPAKPCGAELMMSRKITAPVAGEKRGAILRYPPGEGPLYDGSRHWR